MTRLPTPEPLMPRYRCPKCSQILHAHELRAGKKSVCIACLASHTIPADRIDWLDENGEPLAARREQIPEPVEAVSASVVAVPIAVTVATPVATVARSIPDPAPQPATVVEATPPPAGPPTVPLPEPPVPRPPARHEPRPPAPRPTHAASANPAPAVAVVTPDPTAPVVRSQADIAVALTEILSERMKPRRKARRDLHASTAVWLFLTGVAIALFLSTLVTGAELGSWVVILGAVEVILGYVWILRLTAGRDARRGLVCAIPPLTLYYLGQWKYAKFRPLRFVATGVVLVGLGLAAPYAARVTRGWLGAAPEPAPPSAVRVASASKLEQLRSHQERKAYDKLIQLLRTLNTTDELMSADAGNRAELAAEMRTLCGHPDIGVKVAAMAAYARWGGEDARDICLAALGPDRTEEETVRALELLPLWKDTPAAPRIAENTAALVGRPGRVTTKATAALEEIGGAAAEQAALGLLGRAGDRTTKLIALKVLERVGGDEAVAALARFANTSVDLGLRAKALETVDVIRTRPRRK